MLPVWEIFVALVLFLLTAQFLKFRWIGGQLPPGPIPLPVIGNLWALRFRMDHDIFLQMAATHGSMFTVWLGQTPVVVLSGCKTIRNALIGHSEEVSGRPTTPLFEELAGGKGIIFISGPNWKQQRRYGLTALRFLGVGKKILEGRIQYEAQMLVENLSSNKGKAADPYAPIVHSVSNVLANLAFGHRFASDDKDFGLLIEGTDTLVNFMGTTSGRLYDVFPWLMRQLPGQHQKLFQLNTFMQGFVKQEIKSHKENGTSEEPEDLIGFYLAQIDKAAGDVTSMCNEENLVTLVMDIFMAGTETTSTTLRWSLIHMMNHPEIQGKVQRELDEVLGPSHVIEYEDRRRLPYTTAVIHEIQRYSNIASVGIVRQVIKDIVLEGQQLKKDTIILPNLTSALYDPDFWKAPRQFNPSNFLDEDGHFVTNEAFLVFSAGHRACLGEQLARTVIFIFFTNIFRTFKIQLPEGVKEISLDYTFGSTLKPLPFEMCAVPR